MSNCLFCKIEKGEIPSTLLYEDEMVIAFEDINPQAPVHFLVIPRKHIPSIADIDEGDVGLMGHIMYVVSKLAKERELEQGYRVINNCGPDGGQTVSHIHFHVLGERKMLWPPG